MSEEKRIKNWTPDNDGTTTYPDALAKLAEKFEPLVPTEYVTPKDIRWHLTHPEAAQHAKLHLSMYLTYFAVALDIVASLFGECDYDVAYGVAMTIAKMRLSNEADDE